jgi:hypothetical protein
VLFNLYPSRADSERVAQDAGLNTSLIAFSDKGITNWANILIEAEKQQNSIETIAQIALEEYPDNRELAQVYEGYLGTIGQSPLPRPQKRAAPTPAIKILFLAANPRDTDPLQLDEEVRAIDHALRQAAFRERFVFVQHWAVRQSDLQELLLRHQPEIVHFSGHGSPAGEIILQDDDGESHPLSVRALSTLFSLLKDNIRCVLLDACYSKDQAAAIAQHIDVVIGMSTRISDQGARNFAVAFYRALGYGRSVQNAFDLGRAQIDLANLDEQDAPVLLAPNSAPAQIVFAAQP